VIPAKWKVDMPGTMTNSELKDAVDILRQRAQRVGPQHAYWDIIFDAEALIRGHKTLHTREQITAMVERALSE
jgi:hypothetical protein